LVKSKYIRQLGGIIIILLLYSVPAIGVPYISLAVGQTKSDYNTGYAEVFKSDDGCGLEYGKAKIEWHYWYDDTSEYYYYTYRVYNNEVGTPEDPSDDYHFGHILGDKSQGKLSYDPINSFDVQFGIDIEYGDGSAIVATSTNAGGYTADSTGGDPWDENVDWTYIIAEDKWIATGIDWSATRGGPGTQTITPMLWDKGLQYDGDSSTSDTGSYQYFQIASIYHPGLVTTHVSNGVHSTNEILGDIYGPAVIPEPASCLILGLGSFWLLRRRRGPDTSNHLS